MIWELLQRGRWQLIGGMLGANLLPVILFTLLRMEAGGDLDPVELRGAFTSLSLINMLVFATAIFSSQGVPARLYNYPVPSSTLAAWHMIPAMALMGLEVALSNAFMNAVFHLGLPLWPPTLFTAVMIGAFQASLWWSEKSVWMPVVAAVVVGALGCWYIVPMIRPMGATVERQLHGLEIALLVAVVAGSYHFAVAGISRNRCGEPLSSPAIVIWLLGLLERIPDATISSAYFRSSHDAHYWAEWTKKGWAMPGICVFGLFMWGSIWLVFVRNPKDLMESLLAGGALLSVLGMICGLLIGNLGPSDSNCDIGSFLSSRPISNRALATIILRVALKSVVMSWLIWVVTFAFCFGVMQISGCEPQKYLSAEIRWWYLPGALVGAWTGVGVIATVVLTGRLKQSFQIATALFAGIIVTICVSKYALNHQSQVQLFDGIVAVCGVVFIGIAVTLMLAAWRSSLIGARAITMLAATWVLLVASIVFVWQQQPSVHLAVYVFVTGLAALSVAPVAAAPLAISFNRHR